MALTTFPGATKLYYPYDCRGWSGLTSLSISQENEAIAMGGQVWFKERTGTKNVVRFGFYLERVNVALPTYVRVSLEGISTSPSGSHIVPTGTPLDSVVFNATEMISEGWFRTDPLGSPVAVSYGQKLCVVWRWDQVPTSVSFKLWGMATTGSGRGLPFCLLRDTGGGWSVQGVFPNVVLEFDDGTFGTFNGAIVLDQIGSQYVEQTGSPDRYGLQFRVPWNCKIDALIADASQTGISQQESIGTSDGINRDFFHHANHQIVPGSIIITCGTYTITDDGAGNLIGDVDGTFTNEVDYNGDLSFQFQSPAQPNGTPVVLDYTNVIQDTDTCSLLLYDAADPVSPLGESERIPAEGRAAIGSLSQQVYPLIPEQVELQADTDYIVEFRPNNNSAGYLRYFRVQDAGHRICHGDLNIGQVSRTGGAGSWSAPSTTLIPRLGIRISAAHGGGRILSAVAGTYAVTGFAANMIRGRILSAVAGGYFVTGSQATLVGATHRLTADTGTYSVTGAVANLKRGYVLSAAAGSYAITGKVADLRTGKTISLVAGSYTLTGSTTNFLYGRALSAVTGSYAITGFAATLTYTIDRRINARDDEYAITGFAATLLYARLLDAATGSYALTGSDAALRREYTLSVDAGSYSVTGFSASLTSFARFINARDTEYSVTGFAATLTVGYYLSVDAGSYALTGASATLTVTSAFNAAAGTYAVTGFAATLLVNYALSAEAGSYNLSGSSAALAPQGVLAAEAGVYSITGHDTDLRATRILSLDAGSYSLSGFSASFLRTYFLVAEVSAYELVGKAASLTFLPATSDECRRATAVYVSSPWRNIYPPGDGDISVHDRKSAAYYYCGDLATSISADTGSYVVTGSAATLLVGRYAEVATGLYALAGADAELKRAIIFSADAGSYSFTGSDASLIDDRVLSADAGSYSVVGFDATTEHDYTFSADAGSYTLTGSDASLIVDWRLAADTGIYTITGLDAGLLAGLAISAEAGVYTLTGSDAELMRSYIMPVDTGTYLIEGSMAEMRIGYFLSVEEGVYAVTGDDATLANSYSLSCDAGEYTVTGSDTTLTHIIDRILSVDPGEYNVDGSATTLTATRFMSADSGVYSVAGEDATLYVPQAAWSYQFNYLVDDIYE